MTDDAGDKIKRVVTGAAALALLVRAHVDEQHDEIDRVEIAGVAVFKRRPGSGRPVVLGVELPRWIRGPRRA